MLILARAQPTSSLVRGYLYFITWSCYQRMPLLAKPQNRGLLLEGLGTELSTSHDLYLRIHWGGAGRKELSWATPLSEGIAPRPGRGNEFPSASRTCPERCQRDTRANPGPLTTCARSVLTIPPPSLAHSRHRL